MANFFISKNVYSYINCFISMYIITYTSFHDCWCKYVISIQHLHFFCINTDCHVLSAVCTSSNQVSSLNTSTIYRVVLQASRSGELLYTICCCSKEPKCEQDPHSNSVATGCSTCMVENWAKSDRQLTKVCTYSCLVLQMLYMYSRVSLFYLYSC